MKLRLHLRIIETGEYQECHSLLANFLSLLAVQFDQANRSAVDVNGSTYSVAPGITNLRADGPNNNDSYGLVVGKGLTSVDINDFKLADQIYHGVVQGYLDYGETGIGVVTISGNSAQLAITRSFYNNGTDAITITEVGLITYTGGLYFLIARDLPTPIIVPGKATRTITLTFTASPS